MKIRMEVAPELSELEIVLRCAGADESAAQLLEYIPNRQPRTGENLIL